MKTEEKLEEAETGEKRGKAKQRGAEDEEAERIEKRNKE